jgi:hypothetical protein
LLRTLGVRFTPCLRGYYKILRRCRILLRLVLFAGDTLHSPAEEEKEGGCAAYAAASSA